MGHTQQEKAASRERIVAVTSRRIREEGFERPAIADVMREAGLTHGGFYKHFASRDALITEAVGHAMRRPSGAAEELVAAEDPLATIADAYLSPTHRDDAGGGCGLPALGAEIRHADGVARDAYRARVADYVATLRAADGRTDAAARERAVVALSAMVGALVLSRALGTDEDSDALLAAVRDAVRERRLLPHPVGEDDADPMPNDSSDR